MSSIPRLLTTLLLAASLVVVVGCGSVIEVAIDLHDDAEAADLTITVVGDEEAMFARFTLHLERSHPQRADQLRQAARMDTTGDVDNVLEEAGVPPEEFDDYVAHVLERELEDSDAEIQRRRDAGTLTFTTVERGAMRGQAMTLTDVAVGEIPETLEDLAQVDRDSLLEDVVVTRDGGDVTVVFDTGREQDGADLSAVSPFQHDLIVTVPGEVVEHNAKDVDGARLEWNQAATAEASVTYRPGPRAERDANTGAASEGRAGERQSDSDGATAEDETDDQSSNDTQAAASQGAAGSWSSPSFGAVLSALVALALLTAITVAVLLDRRSQRAALAVAPAPSENPPRNPLPGWYGDPTGQARLRWWDGGRWTDHVA